MEIVNWMTMCLLAGALVLTGCGKIEVPAPVVSGVTVDLPKLREAFATASPELQAAVSEVGMGVRYADYGRALSALEKLSNAPGLTDPQKKIANEATEQVKTLASKANSPPAR
jgi:hypothetical protein